MSLLVDKQIKGLIDKGEIKIDPYNESYLGSGSYKISLGKVLLIPIEGQKVVIEGGDDPKYERVEISKEGYVLRPGMFVLGQSREKITIPKYIGVLVDTRSTLARLGVSAQNTAMYLEPGHKDSIVTLEIFNAGKFDVVLKEGKRVAKLVFISSSDSASRGYSEYGKYSVQNETTGAKM